MCNFRVTSQMPEVHKIFIISRWRPGAKRALSLSSEPLEIISQGTEGGRMKLRSSALFSLPSVILGSVPDPRAFARSSVYTKIPQACVHRGSRAAALVRFRFFFTLDSPHEGYKVLKQSRYCLAWVMEQDERNGEQGSWEPGWSDRSFSMSSSPCSLLP